VARRKRRPKAIRSIARFIAQAIFDGLSPEERKRLGLKPEDGGIVRTDEAVTNRGCGQRMRVFSVRPPHSALAASPPEGICRKCGRTYTLETDDFGLCCICFRDMAYERVYGPTWREIILKGRGGSSNSLPNCQQQTGKAISRSNTAAVRSEKGVLP